MCAWIVKELDVDVPIHFCAFQLDYKMNTIPGTPIEALSQARKIAPDAGLQYIYTGNVHNQDGDSTYCPSCNSDVIVRDCHQIQHYRLTQDGCCTNCNTPIAGRFEAFSPNIA